MALHARKKELAEKLLGGRDTAVRLDTRELMALIADEDRNLGPMPTAEVDAVYH